MKKTLCKTIYKQDKTFINLEDILSLSIEDNRFLLLPALSYSLIIELKTNVKHKITFLTKEVAYIVKDNIIKELKDYYEISEN